MYPISNAVKALFEAEQVQVLRITGTDKNGTAINITDADVVIGSFNIDRCSCNGEKLEVGTAIASEMTFKLDNFDGRFNSVVFEGTELFVEIGIADWTLIDLINNTNRNYFITNGFATSSINNGVTIERTGSDFKLTGNSNNNYATISYNASSQIASVIAGKTVTLSCDGDTANGKIFAELQYKENGQLRFLNTATSRNGNPCTISIPSDSDYARLVVGLIPNSSCSGQTVRVKLEIGGKATNWIPAPEDVDLSTHWIPCGYFTPDEQPRSLNIITIHALDRMTRFDKIPPAAVPWTTKAGTNITTESGAVIEFLSNIQFPITVQNLVKRVCMLCNVPLATVPSRTNSLYMIPSMPTLQQDVTFRNLIQWCAGIMCSNAWINWNGALDFSFYNTASSYLSTIANRFSSDIYENDISFTGVSYTNTQGATIVSGSAEYTLDLTGNYLAANGLSIILPNIRTYLNNFVYRPFSASVINAPYLWPLDRIQVIDKTGITRQCLLTNVNFGINSTTELRSKGETAQTNSATAPSGVTNEQAFLVEKATKYAADHAIDSMTQEEIFNKLTNNGAEQALILYNGRLYLNATYINTGTLVASLLKAGILRPQSGNTNNYWNMETGEFSLKSDGASNGITYKNGVLDINASNIKAGVLSDAAGVNTWNMQTGDMNVTGSFTATTEIDGDTYTLKLQDNQLGLYVNNQLRGYIGWDELLGLGIHASAGTTAILDATTTVGGELTGGSYVRVNKNGDIELRGRKIVVGAVDELPQDSASGTITFVKAVNFNSSSVTYGHITVKNGIIVDWD